MNSNRKASAEMVAKKLVSIIVPVYNAEKHLDECVKSIISQTHKNIEVLLIDDGSSDNSAGMCDNYAATDERVKAIHKKNGGVSSARNSGLDIARGDYVFFLDSDDFLDKECLAQLLEDSVANDSDLVFCSYTAKTNEVVSISDENIPRIVHPQLRDKIFFDFVARFCYSKHYIRSAVWGILYKKSLVEKIRFNRCITIGEDLVFLLHALFRSEVITSISRPLYFYRINNLSATRTYKKNYLKSQLHLYPELSTLFEPYDSMQSTLQICGALSCYFAFSNEIKFRPEGWRKNICEARASELYPYFNLTNWCKLNWGKQKIKYLIVFFLVKFRLV